MPDRRLALCILDADNFKAINDMLGHAVGDSVIRTCAGRLVGAVDSRHFVGRIGGDEFVVLLTVPTCGQGDIAAERLHDRLSRILRGTGHQVTCSMGAMVVQASRIGSPERLVEAADGLMYEVKRSGKNGLRVARLDLQPNAPVEVLGLLPERRSSQPLAIAEAA